MDKKFTIERQGKSFVLYAGLLDEAHRQGLLSIRTKILQFPAPENGNCCIAHAEAVVEKASDGGGLVQRTFEGIGDASEANVVGGDGLPLPPLRTDDWPLESTGRRYGR